MAASLPGPLGGQLAGAEGRGVPDGLPPVLRRRGARVLRAGAIGFQPLAQLCQLAVAVPGVPGERQGLQIGRAHV